MPSANSDNPVTTISKYQHMRRAPRSRSAKSNRSDLNSRATRAERLFADALSELGIKYIQNFTVRTAESFSGYYLVDFYLPQHKTFVEVDGGVHRSEAAQWKDRLRTEAIKTKHPDVKLVRLWNSQVETNAKKEIEAIIANT